MNALIAALHDPRAYPHPTNGIALEETHISWVLLTGTYAYKIKKPVNFGFVDFSSLERRRHFCKEELRLNSRLAPEIYLDLVEIHGPLEQANLRGQGPVIEVAVRMHQFDRDGLLPKALDEGLITGEQLETFATRLAIFHGAAEIAPAQGPYGTPQAVMAAAAANLDVLMRLDPLRGSLKRLREWTDQEGERLEGLFNTRLGQGRVREGHGDLHLGNLVLHQGSVVGFDCLEFNPSLRWIDVISDVAFLAMDLEQRGELLLARRMLNHWLISSGDYGSLSAWQWYLTYRALVRAKVLALRLEQMNGPGSKGQETLRKQLGGYIAQAIASCTPSALGALVLMHGVTGSGKSHIALELCQRHGWMHLRSDVERRRLFGRWGTQMSPLCHGDAYAPAISAKLYDTILPTAAEAVVLTGLTVVVDATFLRRHQRERFRELANQLQIPLLILSCPVSLEVATERIAKRRALGGDPSEADESVLISQWQTCEALESSEGDLQIAALTTEAVERDLQDHVPRILRTIPGSLPRPC